VFLHHPQYLPPHLGQNFVVTSWRRSNHMMERLVHPTNLVRRQSCRHRLDALALSRQ
jgi:hypothetical protein